MSLFYHAQITLKVKIMVEIKSPIKLKDLEGKAGVGFKTILGLEGAKKDLYDSDRMLIISLEKGECVAFVDRNDSVWELSRNTKGRYNLRRLTKKRIKTAR